MERGGHGVADLQVPTSDLALKSLFCSELRRYAQCCVAFDSPVWSLNWTI